MRILIVEDTTYLAEAMAARLRKKLAGSGVAIQTRRGLGYRIHTGGWPAPDIAFLVVRAAMRPLRSDADGDQCALRNGRGAGGAEPLHAAA